MLWGCADCNREGCDALRSPAPQQGTGIAGVVAGETDVVEDGCQECGFGSANLRIWQLDAPAVDPAAAREITASIPPTQEHEASGHYRVTLAAGSYLFCNMDSCINVQVVEGATSTVNVKQRYGPTSFFHSVSGSAQLTEDYGFSVGQGAY